MASSLFLGESRDRGAPPGISRLTRGGEVPGGGPEWRGGLGGAAGDFPPTHHPSRGPWRPEALVSQQDSDPPVSARRWHSLACAAGLVKEPTRPARGAVGSSGLCQAQGSARGEGVRPGGRSPRRPCFCENAVQPVKGGLAEGEAAAEGLWVDGWAPTRLGVTGSPPCVPAPAGLPTRPHHTPAAGQPPLPPQVDAEGPDSDVTRSAPGW